MKDNQAEADGNGVDTSFDDLSDLDGMAICERLKRNDLRTWQYVLETIIDQEKRSGINSRKCFEWGVPLDSLISRLYDEMVGKCKKLDAYCGTGSLIGWLRSYIRGYLNRENPHNRHEVSLDALMKEKDEGEKTSTLEDKVSFRMSEYATGRAFGSEDDQILLRERKRIARRCFKELWLGNSIQAYVMLLKTRFQMSSLEIKERLGVSSADNVDQMFARAVRKMREAREKYED